MMNLDTKEREKTAIFNRINEAVKNGDEAAFATAFADWTKYVEDAVLAEARGLVDAYDNKVLAGRGVRQLTSEERKFYDAFIAAAKSAIPQMAFTGTDVILPKTIIDSVFEDVVKEHPLLSFIDFQPTAGLTEILISTTSGAGVWGDVTAAISGELSANFTKIELAKNKFTAYVLIAKGMLDLGPEWLDRYIRAMLVEALAYGLESAIVDGNGKNKPIGMTRKLSGDSGGEYPYKTPVTITDLSQDTYGTILNTLSQAPNNNRRAISRVLLVVNPADYYTKVMPATTVLAPDGTYTRNVFPFPTDVVQSAAMPAGYAVMGIADKYFVGLGSAREGRIEYDDSVKWFEDQRAYSIRFYADGRAKDENAFVYLNITNLERAKLEVKVTNTAVVTNTAE